MAQRKLELIALALLVAYAILYFTTRTPVCEIGRVGVAGIDCRQAPPPPLDPRPNGGFVVMLEKPGPA